MTGKAWLVLFLFALWCAFSAWFYNCKVKGLCGIQKSAISSTTNISENQNRLNSENSSVKTKELSNEKESTENIDENTKTSHSNTIGLEGSTDTALSTTSVNLNSAEIPKTTIDELLKNDLFASLAEGEKILINGKYFESESNSTGQENLGFARALNFKEVLSEKIGSENIEVTGELIEGEASELAMKDLLSFSKISPKEEKELARRDGKVIIYFDFISDNPILGDEVKQYLNGVAQDLVADRTKFIVATGYSDSKGNTKNNYYMGQHRAEAIRAYLVEQGARANQVHVKSFGEYRPVADNTTEEGRAKNRRVEIKLNY